MFDLTDLVEDDNAHQYCADMSEPYRVNFPDNIRDIIFNFLQKIDDGETIDDTMIEPECRKLLTFRNKDDMIIYLEEEVSEEKKIEIASRLHLEELTWRVN